MSFLPCLTRDAPSRKGSHCEPTPWLGGRILGEPGCTTGKWQGDGYDTIDGILDTLDDHGSLIAALVGEGTDFARTFSS